MPSFVAFTTIVVKTKPLSPTRPETRSTVSPQSIVKLNSAPEATLFSTRQVRRRTMIPLPVAMSSAVTHSDLRMLAGPDPAWWSVSSS